MTDKKIDKNWRIEYKKPIELSDHKSNPRKISKERFELLKDRIKSQGFRVPPSVDNDYILLAGHQRIKALIDMGLGDEPIAISVPEFKLTEKERQEILSSDNLSWGEFDYDILANEFEMEDLIEWGFDKMDFGVIELEPEETKGDDNIPESAPPITVKGDLYTLGEHRLLCGDSTMIDDVEKLMDGEKADMVFTDPPYGISHSGKGITANGVKGNDFGEIMGDSDVTVAIDAFNLVQSLLPEAVQIFWGANYYCSALPNGHGWLVWDKEREGNTFSGAELAFVNQGVRLDVFRHMWHGMVKASEQGQARVHPTQKPVALAEWCFENYGSPSSVLDLFGGSGTTLIACEKTNRKCYGMELDEKYCDVIVKRYVDFCKKNNRNYSVLRNGKPCNDFG
jgi:16S rRNA G966 N2-methylase RsmD